MQNESSREKRICSEDADEEEWAQMDEKMALAWQESLKHPGRAKRCPPYLRWMLRHIKSQSRCPFCGSTDTARYIFGYPIVDEIMEVMLASGRWELGGCKYSYVEIEGRRTKAIPGRRCNTCRMDFGTPPVLMCKNGEEGKDCRKAVSIVSFSWKAREGWKKIRLTRTEEGAEAEWVIEEMDRRENWRMGKKAWQRLLNRLYADMHLHEWQESRAESTQGETAWRMEVNLGKYGNRMYTGNRQTSPYGKELVREFERLEKQGKRAVQARTDGYGH